MTCGPCDAADRYSSTRSGPVPSTDIGLRDLADTWSQGFPAFQAASGLDAAEAASLAESLGLIPRRWLLTAERLAEMACHRRTPTSTFADRWQVSRWTVAAWRRELGLERLHARATRRAEAPPVDGVHIICGDQTTVEGPEGPIRLGRSARALVDAIVASHPDPVDDADLRRLLFPDSTPDRGQAALHATVSRLRRHLPDGTIRRTARGYRLAVVADSITDPAVAQTDRAAN